MVIWWTGEVRKLVAESNLEKEAGFLVGMILLRGEYRVNGRSCKTLTPLERREGDSGGRKCYFEGTKGTTSITEIALDTPSFPLNLCGRP